MPSDNSNPAKIAATAAARQARAESAAAMRTAMNVSRNQMGKQPHAETAGGQWITALVVVVVVIGMLVAVMKFAG